MNNQTGNMQKNTRYIVAPKIILVRINDDGYLDVLSSSAPSRRSARSLVDGKRHFTRKAARQPS